MSALVPGILDGIATANGQALFIEPNWTDDPTDGVDFFADVLGNAGVRQKTDTVVDDALDLWDGSFTLTLYSHAEQRAFFDFRQRARGRTRSFWMPSWRTDFNVVRDISPDSGNLIDVAPCGFDHVFRPDRFGLFVETTSRVYYTWKIVGYDDEIGRLTVGSSVDVLIPRSSIARCSLIRRVRFDQDRFPMKFVTDTVVEIGVAVHEVRGEGVFI